MGAGKKFKWLDVARVLAGLVAVCGLCGGMVVWDRTLVSWWVPVVWALAGASLLLRPLGSAWRKFTASESAVINVIGHMLFFGCIIYFGVLEVNYLFTGPDAAAERVAVTVEAKYTKEHTRVRRLRKGVTVPAGKYTTYHVELAFANGKVKDIQLPLDSYNRMRRGSETEIGLRQGILGWPVIEFNGF